MATWPSYVKGPLEDSIQITLGSTVTSKVMQDERRVRRRQGSNPPDILNCSFYIPIIQQKYFRQHYERDLNMGLNWMSPSWLVKLGYSSHSIRFLGYPSIQLAEQSVVKYGAQFLIQLTSIVKADTFWPETSTP
jgi:hypothetical protein